MFYIPQTKEKRISYITRPEVNKIKDIRFSAPLVGLEPTT